MAPDPISLVSLSIQILQIALGVVQELRDAPQQYRELRSTIQELPPILHRIVRTVIEQEQTELAEDFTLLIGPLEALNRPLLLVQTKLRKIHRQGGVKASRFRVRWMLWNKGEVQQLVQTLESQKGTLLTAMQTLNMRTTVRFGTSLENSTRAISRRLEDIHTSVLPRQQGSLDSIHAMVVGLPHQQDRLEQSLRMLTIRAQRQDRLHRIALGRQKRGRKEGQDVIVIGRKAAEDAVTAELTLMIRKAAGRTFVPALLCVFFFEPKLLSRAQILHSSSGPMEAAGNETTEIEVIQVPVKII